MSLDILIKVDPGASAQKARSVTEELHKTENQGLAAGKAMSGLAGAFGKLAEALQREQTALARTTALHDRLTAQNAPLAVGFSKVADAIRREQEMLNRIHGPAQRYAADLQVLDSLLDRNKISTLEYAEQVSRLNRELSKSPSAHGAPSVAAANDNSGGMLGGLKKVAAVTGATLGIREIGGLANEFQTLENRLRYLAGGDLDKVNSMFARLQVVAANTRADLSATTEAFVRISLATKQMGLSQEDTFLLTERLNKAITLSGATGAEAAAGMVQLSQGLASGALRGDELRSVMEQLPAVADVIAGGLGVTRGQLRKMGEEGKITADVIVNAFKKAGTSLDSDFGNTVPTISQQFTLFKNDLMVTVGELAKSTNVSKLLGDALSVVGEMAKIAAIPIKLLGGVMGALNSIGIESSTTMLAFGGFLAGGPIGAVAGLTVGLLAQAGAFDDVTGAAKAWLEVQEENNRRQWEFFTGLASGRTTVEQYARDTAEAALRLSLGAAAAAEFNAKTIEFSPKLQAAAEATRAWAGTFGQLGHAMNDASFMLGKLEAIGDSPITRALGMGQDRAREVREAKLNLDALHIAYKNGTYNLEQYNQKKQQLRDLINGTSAASRKAATAQTDEDKLLERINAAQYEQSRGLAVLALAYGNGSVTLSQYNDELQRLMNLTEIRSQAGFGSITPANDNITGNLLASATPVAMPYDQEAFAKAQEEFAGGVQALRAEVNKSADEDAVKFRDAWLGGAASISRSFYDAARAGEDSFGEMVNNMLRDLAILTLKLTAMRFITGQFGAGSGIAKFAGSLLGIGGGANGFDHLVAPGGRLELPGFARGGDAMVGGTGGTDSKLAMLRITPGESLHVRTPEQRRAVANENNESRGATRVTAIMQNDRRDLVEGMDSRDGEAVFVRLNRKVRGRGR